MVKAKTEDIEKIVSRSDYSTTLSMSMLSMMEIEKIRQGIIMDVASGLSNS